MRRLLVIAALLGALLSAPSAFAAAAPGSGGASASAGVGLPYAPVGSLNFRPPGFSTTGEQAMAAAKAAPAMQALHRRLHPLFVEPFVFAGRRWTVDFLYHNKLVAEADVNRRGQVTGVYTGPLAVAIYARGHFAPIFDSWWVVVPFSLLFLLPFLSLRRPWRLLHLDGLVLLSFFVSYGLFDHTHLEAAVWTAYPPLIYLLVRMVGIAMRPGRGVQAVWRRFDARYLGAALLALVAVRVALSLVSQEVGDVGYASVIGAHRIAHGLPLYFASAGHGDTYGPVAYLAYVPFEVLFPWRGIWDYLLSAHIASLVFDLVTIVGLVVLGRRLRPGADGRRLGLVLGWAWAACPFTLLALMMHTNDGLVAMLSVLSLLVFASPTIRGAFLGLAAAAKFSPAGLLPLFASPRDRGLKGTLEATGAFCLVVAGALIPYLPSGGLKEFYDHTIGYQLTRPDVFSPWALHPSLDALKLVLTVGAIALALAVAFMPRRRGLVEVCALAGAVTIAVQLPAVHWFYYYIVWFVPFVLVALLARSVPEVASETVPAAEEDTRAGIAAEPVLAGV